MIRREGCAAAGLEGVAEQVGTPACWETGNSHVSGHGL